MMSIIPTWEKHRHLSTADIRLICLQRRAYAAPSGAQLASVLIYSSIDSNIWNESYLFHFSWEKSLSLFSLPFTFQMSRVSCCLTHERYLQLLKMRYASLY